MIFEGKALMKLDKDSNILWAHRNGAHHDFQVMPGGEMWILTREAHVVPDIHPTRPVLEDFVSLLDANGEERQRFSLLDAVGHSPYAPFLGSAPEAGDLLHTNSLEILDGAHEARVPAFRRGRLLLSVHTLNVIAVLDPDGGTIVWAMSGLWKRQHDPNLLENGDLLVFDNQGHDGMSQVIELDPTTQQIVWAYRGTPENGFYTELCGANQRLPNGNTLITESERGRAFEVAPDGVVVWEYRSPHRAGAKGDLVATLLEVVRLDPSTPLDWIGR